MFQQIHNLKIIHVFAGWSGLSADGLVLKQSPLSETLPDLMDNNSEYLMDTYYILGEKVFLLTKLILSLYKKNSGKCSHCSYIK